MEGTHNSEQVIHDALTTSAGLERHTRVVVLHRVPVVPASRDVGPSSSNKRAHDEVETGRVVFRADEYFWYSHAIAPGGRPLAIQCSRCMGIGTLQTSAKADGAGDITVTIRCRVCKDQELVAMPAGVQWVNKHAKAADSGWCFISI